MIKIFVVVHDWQDDEAGGNQEIAYFTQRSLAEEFRQKFIKHWQERDKDDYNCPNEENTSVEEIDLYGEGEWPELPDKKTTIVDIFNQVLREKNFSQETMNKLMVMPKPQPISTPVIVEDDGWRPPF